MKGDVSHKQQRNSFLRKSGIRFQNGKVQISVAILKTPHKPNNSFTSIMPFGLSRRRNKPHRVAVSSPDHHHYGPERYCGMILRLNIDCNACCRKLRRIVLSMKGIETHMIEKQQRRLFVVGTFVPSDVAIYIKKKMNRRVEILEIQELIGSEGERDQTDESPPQGGQQQSQHQPPPGCSSAVHPCQPPCSCQPVMPLAYCKSPYSAMETVQVWDNCECACILTEEEVYELPYDEDMTGFDEVPSWENNYLDYY